MWSQKSKFINEQETSWLLNSFGIKTHLSKIPLVGPLLLRVLKKLIQDIK